MNEIAFVRKVAMEVKILTSCDTEWWAKVAMYAKNCSWQPTGQYLSNRMKNNEFSNWERVFVALENGDMQVFAHCRKLVLFLVICIRHI